MFDSYQQYQQTADFYTVQLAINVLYVSYHRLDNIVLEEQQFSIQQDRLDVGT